MVPHAGEGLILGLSASKVGVYVAAITAALALLTLLKGLQEYALSGRLARFEKFHEMKKHFRETEFLRNICVLLEDDSVLLSQVELKDRFDFIAFYEQLSIMMNSGIINRKVAHYMFGYYAIRCEKSEYFWSGINKDGWYWREFRRFAHAMIKLERTMDGSRPALRL